MIDPENMSACDLEQCLAKLRGDLEDLEEERMFMLGQTGLHVSAGQVKKYETQLETLRSDIEEVQQLLRTRQPH